MLTTLPRKEAQERLETLTMGERLKRVLISPAKSLLPPFFLRRVVGRSRSPLVQETLKRPGSWLSTHITYANQPPVDWIDRMAMTNPVARALRNRRHVVTRVLSELVAEFAAEGPFTVVGVGAGPGTQIQDAMQWAEVDPSLVSAWIIDLQDDAFSYGMDRAEQLGMEHSFSYLKGDARKISEILPEVHPQVVKLIGIIEYLTDDQLDELLAAFCEVMPSGSALVTNSFIDKYGESPFLSKTFGLKHVYRSAEQVAQRLMNSGFQKPLFIDEPMGIHSILVSRR